MNPEYSIIITTKNEEESIGKILCSIPESVKEKAEVIVVDSSDDHTPLIARRLGAKVITEKRKGKGRAMKTGVERSKGDVIIFMDGDGTDPPQYIPELLKKLDKSDMVLGSRSMKKFKEDDAIMRDVFRVYRVFVRSFFTLVGFDIKGDPLAGFRAIRRKDWKRLGVKADDFTVETEMNLKSASLKFKVESVPIPHLKRGGGLLNSKLVTDPVMWIKIMAFALKYVKDGTIKKKVSRFRNSMRKEA